MAKGAVIERIRISTTHYSYHMILWCRAQQARLIRDTLISSYRIIISLARGMSTTAQNSTPNSSNPSRNPDYNLGIKGRDYFLLSWVRASLSTFSISFRCIFPKDNSSRVLLLPLISQVSGVRYLVKAAPAIITTKKEISKYPTFED